MDIDFQCTKCGSCCKDLRAPLTVDEAIDWLRDGNAVQVLCEAIPWADELPASNLLATYKRDRSFAAMSGTLPIRVLVTLAAPLDERCPNLQDNDLCGIYDRRPSVCRTYPAETNPFLVLAVERRRCPPEAWSAGGVPLVRGSRYIDSGLRQLIQTSQDKAVQDVPLKEAACSALGIDVTAMANEGYVAHSPDSRHLLDALLESRRQPRSSLAQDWAFMSNRPDTVDAIRSCGATCTHAEGNRSDTFKYLSLFAN